MVEGGGKREKRDKENLRGSIVIYRSMPGAQGTASALSFPVDEVEASKEAEETNQPEFMPFREVLARQCLPRVPRWLPPC